MPVNLVPRPVKLRKRRGEYVLTPKAAISAERPGRAAADLLASRLRTGTGWRFPVRAGGPAAIRLTTRGAPRRGPESYALSVGKSGATIRAGASAGFFHGVQTLRQLLPVAVEFCAPVPSMPWQPRPWPLPFVDIEDWPRWAWRSMLIDPGRHFLPKDLVLRIVDALALYKMNRLHWHLTEDQGWRLDIRRYPRLRTVAAWRGPTRYGGYYTAADVKEVVAHAAARGVEVVPEIELPGHSQAALAAYPKLGCTGGPYKVGTQWGIYKDVYCAGNEKVFAFLEGVLDEVCRLFPGRFVHLGADEVPKDRWEACPKCRARMRREGLVDGKELQTWFVHRIIRHLERRGKRCICWDEILEGGAPPGVIVQAWRANQKAVSKAAAAGREVIHSPYSHVYINDSQRWCTLEHVWKWNPLLEGDRKDLTPVRLSRPELMLGGEVCLWGEWCPPERFSWQAFPRLLAGAEILWSPDPRPPFARFRPRALAQAERLATIGLTPGPERL